MEGQITLNEWMQWKEDIRRKLQETASNFVYIGYRLKQIRDSGMYDGCANIFEFAEKEYHLERTTVSRFMSINDKFSKHGNSVELRDEFVGLGQSQLSEMLSLPVNDYDLITEDTAIKDIRELKRFEKDAMNEPVEENGTEDTENASTMRVAENPDSGNEEQSGTEEKAAKEKKEEFTPLQRCIIDFFKDRQELLLKVLEIIDRGDDEGGKEIAELLSPTGSATHRKSTVFLLMYDYKGGIKYKVFGQPDPVIMSWEDLIHEIEVIYTYETDGNYTERIEELYSESVHKTVETVNKTAENGENPQKSSLNEENPQKSAKPEEEDIQPAAAPTACQPAKPVDVWDNAPRESVCDVAQKDSGGVTDISKIQPREEPEAAADDKDTLPAAADNEEALPAAADKNDHSEAAGAEEIRQAYHKAYWLIMDIEKRLARRNWKEAADGADVLTDTIEWLEEQDTEEVNKALDEEFDDE